jgi:hypothetical protein
VWRGVTWTSFERAVKLALGVALTWHQAAIASTFNPYVFTGGLTLLGVTEAVRWDLARRGAPEPPPLVSSQNGAPPSRSPERAGS